MAQTQHDSLVRDLVAAPQRYRAVRANPLITKTYEAYVPNRDRDGRLVHNHENWVRLVEAALASASGGLVTTYEARGSWRGGYEHCSVVRAAVAGADNWASATQALAETLGRFAEETGQEVAGFTVEGTWYYCAREEES
jgi:hypothetical protein